jgi:hypothetical protein
MIRGDERVTPRVPLSGRLSANDARATSVCASRARHARGHVRERSSRVVVARDVDGARGAATLGAVER